MSSTSKIVLYDVAWQIRRVMMLAENDPFGGFGCRIGTLRNIESLQKYIEEATGVEKSRRIWRALNLMNATLLGFGSRGFEQKAMVVEARDEWSLEHSHGDLLKPFTEATWWEQVRRDLLIAPDEGLELVWTNLQKRVKTADQKAKRGVGGMQFRPDLQIFLELLKERLA